MPNVVNGSSEAADKLANDVVKTTKRIIELCGALSSQAKTIKDAYKAKDNGCIDEMVNSIQKSLLNYIENIQGVTKGLRDYADFLRQHGM